MKTIKTIASLLCAAVATLTFTQCNNTSQAPVATQVVCDSTPALKIAYVDIDTLLTSRNGLLADDCARKERVHHQGDAYGEGGCKARGIHPQTQI